MTYSYNAVMTVNIHTAADSSMRDPPKKNEFPTTRKNGNKIGL